VSAAAAVAAVAWPVGRLEPLVGAPVVALALGVLAATALGSPGRLGPGVALCSRSVLQAAIVTLGASLSLGSVASVGLSTLPVLAGTLAAAFAVAAFAGRRLGVPPVLRTLVGVGTGICGASAIAAVSTVLSATQAEVAYAVSTIFAFNLLAVVVFPPLGHLLGLSQSGFGLWAGTAVNDTSSVVAAAYAYGNVAGAHAVLVKLTRTLAIVPVVAFLGARRGRTVRWTRVVPWFVVWFLLAAAASSVGVLPAGTRHGFQQAALALFTVALAAVGLSTSLAEIRRAGARPLLLGTLVWAAVAVTGLLLAGGLSADRLPWPPG